MSDNETSGEIATIAGSILNLPEAEKAVEVDKFAYNDLLKNAKSLAGSCLSQRELIEAQADGTLVLTPKMEVPEGRIGNFVVTETTNGGLFVRPTTPEEDGIEVTFQFYVDGYTLAATANIGEVDIVGPGGEQATIRSKSLTDFLDRRLGREPDPG